MELSSKTKVNELLSKYPFLREFLIKLDPQFKALDNPIMMKTLGRVATLGRVTMVTGVSLEKLLPVIAAEVKKQANGVLVIKKDESEDGKYSPAERIQILKDIIRDLHKGVDRKALTERFQKLIKDVAPTEIAQMEQQLMAEGMPEEEIKKLCDVHVEVFRGGLDKEVRPGMPAGHPVHTYMLENRHAEVPSSAATNFKGVMRGRHLGPSKRRAVLTFTPDREAQISADSDQPNRHNHGRSSRSCVRRGRGSLMGTALPIP